MMVDMFCRTVKVGDWVAFPVSRTIPRMSCGQVVGEEPDTLIVKVLPTRPGYAPRTARLKHGANRLLIINKEYIDGAKQTKTHPRFYEAGSYPRYEKPFVRPFGFWENDEEPTARWHFGPDGVIQWESTADQPREVSRTLPVVSRTRSGDGDHQAIPRCEASDDDPEGMGWC